ncbi:MAG: DNA-processing protein DprA [Kiritimatiellae bacterium]|nr:DNA-processing protein DprA [Kiritimatiellia bacterium]
MIPWKHSFENTAQMGPLKKPCRLHITFHGYGPEELLASSYTAFLCSVKCPGSLILQCYDLAKNFIALSTPVIGGFHSPVEREVLNILLRASVPVCVVMGRGLPVRIPAEFRQLMEEGRMILASPFDGRTKRATAETALKRNLIISALAEKVFVAYAAPGSKTETLCRVISKWNKPRFTFNHEANRNLLSMGFSSVEGGIGKPDCDKVLEKKISE